MNTLWIDQDEDLVNSARPHLPSEIKVEHCPDLLTAHSAKVDWANIDLLLMEMKIGGGSTLDFISELRKKRGKLPILLITSHAEKENCIQAINLGVNGIIEKPIDYSFLLATIQKFRQNSEELILDVERKAVFSHNRWIDLTSTEFRILEALKVSQRRMTRLELQAAVWPGSSVSENNLDTHLTNLKRKIPVLNQYLSVKRGLGYFLLSKPAKN